MKMEAIVTTVRIYIRIASVRKLSMVFTSALTMKGSAREFESAEEVQTYIC